MRPHDSQAVEDVIEVAVLVRIDFASALVARVELAGPDAWCCTAIRLASWMTDKLKVSRVEHPQPRTVEAAII
jgi:hypothetical protein